MVLHVHTGAKSIMFSPNFLQQSMIPSHFHGPYDVIKMTD